MQKSRQDHDNHPARGSAKEPVKKAAQTPSKWDHPGAFVHAMVVADSDIDALEHANNAAYLKWLEETAWLHAESLGMSWNHYQAMNVAVVVRRHELEYLAATYAGDALEVATWIIENDERLSLWRGFQIIRQSDNKTVMRAKSHFVCVRLDSGRACRMPEAFKRAYAATP